MKLPKLILKSSSGFTIIELIITVVIAGVLAGIGISYFNSENRQGKLRNAAIELRTNLRYAQNMASSSINECSLGSSEYTYVYLPSNTSYRVSQSCTLGGTHSGKTYNLPPKMTIELSTIPSSATDRIAFKRVASSTVFHDYDDATGNVTEVSGITRATFKITYDGVISIDVTVDPNGVIVIP
jgi:prepilin-type N-terminal cleavage/methylation domain-containing protein